MSDQKQDWRERYEDKDKDGNKVLYVSFWSDGTPANYRFKRESEYEGITIACYMLIPRKPTPVYVPWEPDEVPVGLIVRNKRDEQMYTVITARGGSLFYTANGWLNAVKIFNEYVQHEHGVPTDKCKPCGKVVQG